MRFVRMLPYSTLRIIVGSGIEDEDITDAMRLISDALNRAMRDQNERHSKLFRGLHPDRERFEREGWPGDQKEMQPAT